MRRVVAPSQQRPDRHRIRPAGLVALLGAALALAAVGCSGEDDGPVRAADGRPVVVPERGDPEIRGWYEQLRAMRAEPEAAAEQVTAACMEAAGWAYVPLPREVFVSAALPASWADDERVRVGDIRYELTPQEPWEHGTVNAGREGLSPAEDAAFGTALSGPDEQVVDVDDPVVSGVVGYPATGCRAQAVTEVFGSVEAYVVANSLTGNLHLQALTAAGGSDEVGELDQRWHGCLQEALGDEVPRRVEVPWQAVTAVLERVDQDGPDALTTGASGRLAAADATCRVSTGYTSGRTAVEDRYLTAWRDAYATEAAAARDLYRSAGLR